MNKTEYVNNTFGPVGGTDDLGRVLPTEKNSRPLRDRLVGIFYFLWIGEHGADGPYDVSKLVAEHPGIQFEPENPLWGPYGSFHLWGQPFWGYYLSKDEWVMRRHIEMLTLAGVDFIFFDTTNAAIYESNAKQMLRLLHEYRQQGWDTPKAMFYTNSLSGQTMQELYDTIYEPGYMADTWFYWQGKPVIIGKEDEASDEVKAFFNIKASQWPNEEEKTNAWPWMDFTRPQRVIKNQFGEDESINVSIAQHPQIMMGDSALYGEQANWGRAYHNGANDPAENAYVYGYNFQEQWDRAISADPLLVLVTGWNEWGMQRQNIPRVDRPIAFVDCANYEFSRDADLMRGGYFDNYYMQLIANIRAYKGTAPTPCQRDMHTIDVAGSFDQWEAVSVTYRDFGGSTLPRNCRGFGSFVYQNDSGRNGIVASKVAWDKENLYFYAETEEALSEDKSGTFMNLFIKTCETHIRYDFRIDPASGTVKQCSDGFDGPAIGTVCARYEGNRLMLKVPRTLLNLADETVSFQFKWADSKTEINSYEDLYEFGDAAPIGRLNYIFENM